MSLAIIIIHVIVCIALIMIVLLQTGKGADMGAAFGGGASQTLFGTTGASTFLSKATTVAAIIFMITSLGLAYMSGQKPGGSSVIKEAPVPIQQQAPAETTPETPAAQQEVGTVQTPAQTEVDASETPEKTE